MHIYQRFLRGTMLSTHAFRFTSRLVWRSLTLTFAIIPRPIEIGLSA
jgi:hypothetical protein